MISHWGRRGARGTTIAAAIALVSSSFIAGCGTSNSSQGTLLVHVTGCHPGHETIPKGVSLEFTVVEGSSTVVTGKVEKPWNARLRLAAGTYQVRAPGDSSATVTVHSGESSRVDLLPDCL
jgi:hypothetical protein